jgi:hypothetical protein
VRDQSEYYTSYYRRNVDEHGNSAGRPHQLLDGRRRSVVVDTIANSTWSLEDERKSDKLMVCLKYQCNDFEPNGTCFCCEISKDNDCYSTHDECVDNCHRCKGPNC